MGSIAIMVGRAEERLLRTVPKQVAKCGSETYRREVSLEATLWSMHVFGEVWRFAGGAD